jgi:excisionase family DNA binding protein
MGVLSTAEAAARLSISVRRVQQLVKSGRLPAKVFGGSLMIDEKDLKLVSERKPGRPKKQASRKK